MSVSRHSAELGFTLIKEGLPKSAGSSLAPLQPRAERASGVHSLPAIPSLPLSYPSSACRSRSSHSKKKRKKKKHSHLPFLLSVSVPLLSTLPPSTGGERERRREKKMHQNTDKLFRFFFSPKSEGIKKKNA